MDTSLDTNKKKKKHLFPYTLRGMKLKMTWSSLKLEWEKDLKQYLKTEDPKHLWNALKKNPHLLTSADNGRDLVWEEFLRKRSKIPAADSIYVDPHTIVSETIKVYQSIYFFQGQSKDQEDARRQAKRYLQKINPRYLVPERKAYIEEDTKDGFTHVDPYQMKGAHPSLRYQSAAKVIKNWDRVGKAFKTKKKRYHKPARPLPKKVYPQYSRDLALVYGIHKEEDLKINDIKKIIENKFSNKISENEVKRFNLDDISTITASGQST